METNRRWRHVKRGTTYIETGRAELQMNRDVVEGAFLVIYRGEDGKLWARQEDEFEDGRFVEVIPDIPQNACHIAQLAASQAENARLRHILTAIRDNAADPETVLANVDAALTGGTDE